MSKTISDGQANELLDLYAEETAETIASFLASNEVGEEKIRAFFAIEENVKVIEEVAREIFCKTCDILEIEEVEVEVEEEE